MLLAARGVCTRVRCAAVTLRQKLFRCWASLQPARKGPFVLTSSPPYLPSLDTSSSARCWARLSLLSSACPTFLPSSSSSASHLHPPRKRPTTPPIIPEPGPSTDSALQWERLHVRHVACGELRLHHRFDLQPEHPTA